MKESFSSANDPLVQQYLSAAAQFPEKENLYRQYLAFVDAEMLRLEAKENHDASLLKEAKEKLDKLLTQTSDELLKQRIRDVLEHAT